MKKFFTAALVALMSLTASAQTPEKGEISLTPMAGISYGGFFGYEYKGGGDTPNRDGNVGFTVGAELGVMNSNFFKSSIGVQYINSSTSLGFGKATDFKNDYIAIPVLANFYVADGFAIKAGVQPAFLVSSKIGSIDSKDYVKSFDFTIPVGLSYEFSNIVLDARYYIGTQNLVKDGNYVGTVDGSGFRSLTNGYATITVGYKFKL